MTRREVFFFGAIGGILPILVSILTIDFAPIIDHPESLTLGNYVGYGIRVVGLIAAGGIVAILNPEVRSPIALVQLGVAAPALWLQMRRRLPRKRVFGSPMAVFQPSSRTSVLASEPGSMP